MKSKMNYILVALCFAVLFFGFGVWTMVEFALCLFKDLPFNWFSLVLCLISFGTCLTFSFIAVTRNRI